MMGMECKNQVPLISTSALQNGYTSLIWASQDGHLEVVKALVAAGADINAAENVSA